jgi:hypothetical protein
MASDNAMLLLPKQIADLLGSRMVRKAATAAIRRPTKSNLSDDQGQLVSAHAHR